MVKEETYTVKELAELWKVHPESIRRLVRNGRLEHLRVGRSIRIRQDDIDKYLKKLRKSEDV